MRALADIVGKDADLVFVPTPIAEALEKPAWGHLFKDFHHSMISIEKAEDLLGVRPVIEFMDGHRATYEWFQASGMGDADSPLVDPLWRASWDFEWEAEVAASVRPASASA